MDGYAAQSAPISLGQGASVIALAVALGMLFGGRLARNKSRSLLLALKEAIAIPTISDNEHDSFKKPV